MNLLGKGIISAALFAATASVVMAAPAQAFSFGTDTTVKFTFDGTASDGWYVQNGFLDFGVADGSGGSLFTLFDSLKPVDDGATATYTFIGGQSYNLFLGVETSADSDTYAQTFFTDSSLNTPVAEQFDISSIAGDFVASINFGGTVIGIEDLFLGQTTPFKDDRDLNDYVVNAEKVPTPAAVLPIIGGLLGMASKRKRDEEANA